MSAVGPDTPIISPISTTRLFSPLVINGATRHEKYYLATGDVVFKVENHLFRVHRYFFTRESPAFRDMLSMPCPVGSTLEGMTDDNPINLPGVKSVDFARFLWVFYNPKYSSFDATIEEWTSILALAHFWQFDEAKELAVTKLDKMYVPPVTKAVLARDYDVESDWALVAYATLGARDESITREEAGQLGFDAFVKLTEVRERIRKQRDSSQPSSPRPVEHRPPSPSRWHPRDIVRVAQPYSQEDLDIAASVFGL
ncbi:hypothetical protein BD410DRAFT_775452 [Rickenella mellea]|uniref:BTB domain-containing protein n=1 Tax=Rickenella mellea TaxID=50990 RepID=A0A4Y7PSG6_9AGAM|nr:hypothetical protein BD410DRAFT_775452 [Rickenella mellea]